MIVSREAWVVRATVCRVPALPSHQQLATVAAWLEYIWGTFQEGF
ncbi:MAG: hypothetical protein AAF471_04390 [Myxococcota bacterium]